MGGRGDRVWRPGREGKIPPGRCDVRKEGGWMMWEWEGGGRRCVMCDGGAGREEGATSELWLGAVDGLWAVQPPRDKRCCVMQLSTPC